MSPADHRIARDVQERPEEEAVRVAHHVGLVAERDLVPAVGACVLEREPNDPPGAGDRDRLQRDAGVLAHLEPRELPELLAQRGGFGRAAFELDALIQVLGVLPDDDQVRRGMPDRDARERAGRPHGGEQVELLTERHVHAAEPRADRGRDGTLDARRGSRGSASSVSSGSSAPWRLQRAGAGDRVDPLDVAVRGVEDQPGRGRDLRPDAVPGDDA